MDIGKEEVRNVAKRFGLKNTICPQRCLTERNEKKGDPEERA
jgi:hypothetical protein